MPRIRQKKVDYMQADLRKYFREKMAGERISQTKVAEKLNIKQPAVSAKLNGKTPFDDRELIILFDMLGTTGEEITRLLL